MGNRANEFYALTITNTSFTDPPTVQFGVVVTKILIVSDTLTDDIEFSYNGRDVDGKLHWSDETLTMEDVVIGRIWFKTNNSAGSNIRLFVWTCP